MLIESKGFLINIVRGVSIALLSGGIWEMIHTGFVCVDKLGSIMLLKM